MGVAARLRLCDGIYQVQRRQHVRAGDSTELFRACRQEVGRGFRRVLAEDSHRWRVRIAVVSDDLVVLDGRWKRGAVAVVRQAAEPPEAERVRHCRRLADSDGCGVAAKRSARDTRAGDRERRRDRDDRGDDGGRR